MYIWIRLNGRNNINMSKNTIHSDKNLYEFIDSKTEEYRKATCPERMIVDYISGQTDKFFLKECETYLNDFKIE